ncbi:MAG: hypothetical protein HW414_1496, partial [Dehalococcoidia bacterium]|nr:hypothetical protein [Dehalococcoidia bacterium]
MKRLGYFVSLFMALSLLLAACASPKAPAPAPTPSPAPTAPAPSAPQLTQKQQWIEGAKKESEVQFW